MKGSSRKPINAFMFLLFFDDEYEGENDDAEREEEEGTDALLVQELSPFVFAFKASFLLLLSTYFVPPAATTKKKHKLITTTADAFIIAG
jgi:type I restriction-modification system DNA methylase subunit|tara:strand:- start:410 stop:679 length:270 start_codon:yes stop_codon:yes gene_type:complete